MPARRLRLFRQPVLACALGPSSLSTQKRPNHEHNIIICATIVLTIATAVAESACCCSFSAAPWLSLGINLEIQRAHCCFLHKVRVCVVAHCPNVVPLFARPLSSPALSSPLRSLFKTYHYILQWPFPASPAYMPTWKRVTRL